MTGRDAVVNPAFWRGLSTLAIVVAIVGLIFDLGFGWVAALLSGVFFLVELALKRWPVGGGGR